MFRYHWALIIGPKDENDKSRGFRLHVKNAPFSSSWTFEELQSSMEATSQLLVRIVVGKIVNQEKVFTILRNVPVVQNDPAWNCVTWVKEALAALQKDAHAIGTSRLDWSTVRNEAISYCGNKIKNHRFDGKGNYDINKPATYDLLEGKETMP